MDARGGKIRYAYNSMGKVCAITDQLGNTETFRYDKEGRQIQHRDRKGILTETRYNVYGQPVLQACTNEKGNRHVMGTWEYDDLGQLKKSVAGGFSYTYLYRPDGKLLKKWSSGRQVIACDYYKNGTLKSLTDVSGKTLHYGYDEAGRLSSLSDDEGKVLTEYGYTAAGRLKEIKTPEGFTASYEYDSDGNLSHLRIGNEEKGSLLYDAFMLYDLNGNRTGKTGKRLGVDGTLQKMDTAYSYDSMNRLTEERRVTDGDKYAYDLAGNRLKKQYYNYTLTAETDQNIDCNSGTANIINSAGYSSVLDGEETYCYNERNELTEKKTLSVVTKYLYDENGSLVREKEGSKTASYQYDLLNRQMHVRMPDGREQENLYDGEGLRAGIKENGKESTFLYYNGEILTECSGSMASSVPVRRYQRGIFLSRVEDMDTGKNYAYNQDEQGSTVYITGNNGTVENSYVYDAFGNVLEGKESIENRIQYTGQQYDQETGQYYLRARYYNPVIGRFTQEDTYRGDGLNLYAYCGNNPVIYYDPSGHEGEAYLEKPISESEQSRVEQVDAEIDNGVNAGNGGINIAGGLNDERIEYYLGKSRNNIDSDTVMLGSTGQYDVIAENEGYTYFKMSDEVWAALENEAGGNYDEIWKVNQQFIDQQIATNKNILLSNDPYKGYYFNDGEKRFYQREIDYILSKGYTFETTSEGLWKAVRR